MDRVKSINRVFLATILISIAGAFLNERIGVYIDNSLILLLLSQILLIVPSVAYLLIYKINPCKAIRFHKVRLSNVVLLILFAYLITPLMNFVNAISLLFVRNDISNIINDILDTNGFLLSIFVIAFIPSIFEEAVYRGVFYSEYSKINPLKGVLLSALLFGLMHGNINQFSYAFATGIVFALVIEATNSILSTMIIHFLINGTSILLLEVYPKLLYLLERMYGSDKFNANEMIDAVQYGAAESLDLSMVLQYGLTAIIPTILAFVVFRTIAKNTGRWEYVKNIFRKDSNINTKDILLPNNVDETGVKRRSLVTLSLLIGIAICIFLMIMNEFYTSSLPEQPLEELVSSVIYLMNP